MTPGRILIGFGRAAVLRRAALDVGIEGAGGVEILLHREDDLGGLRRKLAAVVGLAGLHDHRMALPRALDHERAAHRKVLALVVEEMHLRRVEIHAARLVGDDRVLLPAVPQPEHDLREFARARVALGMAAWVSRLKFKASAAASEVTRFQPARPLLIASSEAKKRATVNGS